VYGKLTLYSGSLLIFQGRVMEEMAGRVVSYARLLATYFQDEFLRVRAGGVVVGGKAILLPSPPAERLATFVGLMVRRGAGYIGDEMVHIDPVLRRAHGTGLPLLIPSDDLELFPERGELSARRQPLKPDQMPERLLVTPEELGASSSPPREVGWLVFPYWEPGNETRLEPMGGAPAVFRYTESALNLHVWGERGLVMMREMIEQVPVSRLIVGSLSDAASLILQTAPEMVGGVSA
jgi:hypothetical protein